MKYLITMLLFFSVGAFAAPKNYFPVGKSGANTVYPGEQGKQNCEQAEGQECFEIGNIGDAGYKDPRFHVVQTSNVDDLTKPIYKAPYNSENCDSDADCGSKHAAKEATCTNGDTAQWQKNEVLPGYTLFCTGISGYEQKEVKTVVEDATLKTSIEAADAAKAQVEADVKEMEKHVRFGQRMIAYIGARNKQKSPALTTAQVKTIVETYSTIHALLGSGSLVTAKAEIEALAVNDPLVTQADKDAILGEINAYLGL